MSFQFTDPQFPDPIPTPRGCCWHEWDNARGFTLQTVRTVQHKVRNSVGPWEESQEVELFWTCSRCTLKGPLLRSLGIAGVFPDSSVPANRAISPAFRFGACSPSAPLNGYFKPSSALLAQKTDSRSPFLHMQAAPTRSAQPPQLKISESASSFPGSAQKLTIQRVT